MNQEVNSLIRRMVALSLAALFVVPPVISRAEDPTVRFAVDGRLAPQTGVLVGGTTMVPMRPIFEALGARLTWDAANNSVTAVKSDTTIRLTIGSATATRDGVEVELARAPMLSGGSTLVPLRFVSEALGSKVGWDGDTRTAYIWSPARFAAPARRQPLDGLIELETHTLAVRDDGTVWSWGSDRFEALGNPQWEARSIPAPIDGLTDVVQVNANLSYSLALRKDGTVWHWGNVPGENHDNYRTPKPLDGLSDIVNVTSGHYFGAALKRDGTVWVWGSLWTEEDLPPTRISGITGVKQIAAGSVQLVALKQDGTVWHIYGGDRPHLKVLDDVVRIFADERRTFAIKADGTAYGWGQNARPLPAGIQEPTDDYVDLPLLLEHEGVPFANVVAVESGRRYTLLLQEDGTTWAWYTPYYRHDPKYALRSWFKPRKVLPGLKVTGIAVGDTAALMLTEHGELWGFGLNHSGEIGDGDVAEANAYSLSLFSIRREVGAPAVVATAPAPAAEGVDPMNSLVITYDRILQPDVTPSAVTLTDAAGKSVPVQAHVAGDRLLISPEGPLKANAGYTLEVAAGAVADYNGRPAAKAPAITFTTGAPVNKVAAIAAGPQSTLAVANGTVWAWGDKRDGRGEPDSVGDGVRPTPLAGLSDIVDVAASSSAALALQADGTVWTWGFAELPRETNASIWALRRVPGLPAVSAVTAGQHHYAALTPEGKVWLWGNVGDPPGTDEVAWWNQVPFEMPGISGVKAVRANHAYTAALKNDGTLWWWGEQADSRMPSRMGDIDNVVSFSLGIEAGESLAVRGDGSLWSYEWHEKSWVRVEGISDVARAQAGSKASYMVQKKDGTVWTWTYTYDAETRGYTRYVWEEWPEAKGAVALAAGTHHFAAALPDGTLLTWGANDQGQLGDWTRASRMAPRRAVLTK